MRTKKDNLTIREDAERMLKRIAFIEDRLERIRKKFEDRIRKYEERMGEESAGLLAEAELLRQELERLLRRSAGPGRSLILSSGRIGLRTVWSLDIPHPQRTIRKLVEHGLGDCLRLKQELDRQALARLDENSLRKIGIRRERRESFYAVTKKEAP
ncbi:hypothetical protein GX441_10500 [bacterium]|nr:hypothetical protein [bacterium]